MQQRTIHILMIVTAALWQQAAAVQAEASVPYKGKVLQTLEAGRYTYVEVAADGTNIWAAAPTFSVNVGDEVTVPRDMPMAPFESKTLGRTFDCVYFAGAITVGGADTPAPELPAGHPALPGLAAPGGAAAPSLPEGHPTMAGHGTIATPIAPVEGVTVPEGGRTVAQIYAEKASLANQTVTVRGRVVKFSPQIMDRNWIHIQDGSGSEGTHDLTVTSATGVGVGDLITVTGTLSLDQDFGYGYTYPVLIQDATIVVNEAAAVAAPAAPPAEDAPKPWWRRWLK